MPVKYDVIQNKLTNPASYTCRVVASNVLGYDEVAARINVYNPNIPVATAKTTLLALRESVKAELLAGNSVNLDGFVSFIATLPVKLENATDPLPANPLYVVAKASKPLKDEMNAVASYDRLGYPTKSPSIISVIDQTTGLPNVLQLGKICSINGNNLRFDQESLQQGVELIRPYFLNSYPQRNVGTNNPSLVTIVPENFSEFADSTFYNEARLRLYTKYTENGDIRFGTYGQRCRSAINPDTTGQKICCIGVDDDAAHADVVVKSAVMVEEDQFRIIFQVDSQSNEFTVRLGSMKEVSQGGFVGDAVTISGNGDKTLAGWTDSNITSLVLTISNWSAFRDRVTAHYARRLIEVVTMDDIAGP